MTRQALPWLGVVGATLAATYAIGIGSQMGVVAIIAASLFLLFAWIGNQMAGPVDGRWLPTAVLFGFLIKLVGSSLRYGMVKYIYGYGDAFGYHATGTRLAEIWRTLEVPLVEGRSAGTRFIELLTGALYAPHIPHMVGGFFLYAAIAFGGQLLLYAAFRKALPRGPLPAYAALIFVVPTLSFWPSSIGKDAIMLLAIGLTAWAVSGLFESYRMHYYLWAGAGVGLAAAIRPHVAGLLIVAAAAAMFLAKGPRGAAAKSRRILLLAATGLGVVLVATLAADSFGVDLTLDDLDPLVTDIERRTGQGGSAIAGGAVASIGDMPGAFIRVMFRPLPMDANNAQALFSAVEGTFVLGMFLWKLPSMIGGIPHLRKNPYLMFAFFYTTGFTIAFSAILNYGILARQRSQVMGLFLAIVLGLGANREQSTEPATEPEFEEAST